MSHHPRILVTAALPYANGSIHIGHLVEYLMTDIYVRALRMAGEDAIYVCADDTHGTPIELSARKAGVTPEAFVAKIAEEHARDFAAFDIHFDHYDSTNSEENRRWAYEIYEKLKAGGHVERRSLEQLYDPEAQRFLPDRFVRGKCPKCGAPDQYGDVCEVCASTYEPTDLVEPYSVISGAKPVLRSSEHLFVRLSDFTPFLREWSAVPGRMQPEIHRFIQSWLEQGLEQWCISRDAPYFGFEIPGEKDKYFYVWLDAPVGYISSSERWAQKVGKPDAADALWRRGEGKIVHVIGKDIIYFHTLFWPAMLKAAGLKTPDHVHVHGMLTVNGVKMSKSRGTFIQAATFREYVDPLYLRYYFASKIGPSAEDIDLSLEELVNRVNAELVNNLANLVARGVSFLATKLGGHYGSLAPDSTHHFERVRQLVVDAREAYRRFDLAGAVRAGVEIASLGNKLFQDGAPWALAKTDEHAARQLVTLCLNIARSATVVVAPAVPGFARKVYPMLGLEGEPQSFAEAEIFELVERPVGTPGRIIDRLERAALERVVEASKPPEAAEASSPEASAKGGAKAAAKAPAKIEVPPLAPEITIDDFGKIDLRVGLVLAADTVEGAKKLLRLTIDVGEARPRNVFAGIREAYEPAQLVGRRVAVVANLKPREMRFGVSEGMVLAGGPGGKDVWVLTLADDAVPGAQIK